MKLYVVNCEHYDRHAPTCRLLGAVDFHACETCEKRAPLQKPYHLGWTTIDTDNPSPQPVKHDPAPWPLMARIVARFRGPGEVGVGDTIKTQLGAGGEWFQAAFKALVGKSCKCSDRQAWLNRRFPYPQRDPQP